MILATFLEAEEEEKGADVRKEMGVAKEVGSSTGSSTEVEEGAL